MRDVAVIELTAGRALEDVDVARIPELADPPGDQPQVILAAPFADIPGPRVLVAHAQGLVRWRRDFYFRPNIAARKHSLRPDCLAWRRPARWRTGEAATAHRKA